MKLQIINESRQPESVAPKIKVFDTEADLDAALPDLPNGAIVATKEDETTEYNRDRTYGFWKNPIGKYIYFIADKPTGLVHITFVSLNQVINIVWNPAEDNKDWNGTKGGDSIITGLDDGVYGKPYIKVNNTENVGSWFATTHDCILTIEQRNS